MESEDEVQEKDYRVIFAQQSDLNWTGNLSDEEIDSIES